MLEFCRPRGQAVSIILMFEATSVAKLHFFRGFISLVIGVFFIS